MRSPYLDSPPPTRLAALVFSRHSNHCCEFLGDSSTVKLGGVWRKSPTEVDEEEESSISISCHRQRKQRSCTIVLDARLVPKKAKGGGEGYILGPGADGNADSPVIEERSGV